MILTTAVSLRGFGGVFDFPAMSDVAAFSTRSTSSPIRELIEFSGCPILFLPPYFQTGVVS
ncbi:hypothetical protein ACXK15_004868 [Escherichia coli]